MADCFFESGFSRRATIATGANQSKQNGSFSDFASKYACASGTPLLYKANRLAFDDVGEQSLALTPQARCDSFWNAALLDDRGCANEDGSTFCNRRNIRHCLTYLNQEMASFDLPPLFANNSEIVDIVQFINNTYYLVKEHQKTSTHQNDLAELRSKYQSELQQMSLLNERLKADLLDCERSNAQLVLTNQQLRTNNREISIKLKTEKDEVRRLDSVLHSRDVQYKHESRKKELELEKMKKRMHQLIADKSNKKTAGFQLSEITTRAHSWGESDLFRTVIGSYEERQKELLDENNRLRQALFDLHRELTTILSVSNLDEIDITQGGQLEMNAIQQSSSDLLTEASFQMPFDLNGTVLIEHLRQNCRLVRELVDSSKTTQTSDDKRQSVDATEVEKLTQKLKEYESIIEYNGHLMLQNANGVGDACEVSFLTEASNVQYDSDEISSRQCLLQKQWMQLEEERKKLLEFASKLAKEESAVEKRRLEVLHREFMLLTPLRHNTAAVDVNRDGSAGNLPPLSENVLNAREVDNSSPVSTSAVRLPSTADLLRHLGITSTTDKRTILPATRSAIRNALNSQSTGTRTRNLSYCSRLTTDEINNCNASFDEIRMALFK